MALFIDIRNKMGPIIVIIIGIALGIFVLETALNSNSSLLHGNRDVVGSIDGDKIRYSDYMSEVQQETEVYKLNNPNQPVNDNTTNQIREQAWNKLITDRINDNLYNKLGITVSDAEMKDMFFGNDPSPDVRKNFTNPQTHIFDPMQVKNYVNSLDKPQQGEDPIKKRTIWVNFENYVYNDRLQTKVLTLLKYGLYVPKWMAEDVYNDKNTKYTFDYISIPYSSVADTAVKVTDDELQTYINNNKEKYKQDESRRIEYVVYKVIPSADDTAKARAAITEDYTKLSGGADTNFIKMNADRALDKYYYSKDKIAEEPLKDTLFKAPVGSIIGPVYKNGSYFLAKITDRKLMPDSVKISLIDFSKQGADSLKQLQKADSVFNAIKAGAPFEPLAQKYSDDKASAAKGGDFGFVKQGNMEPKINDFLFFRGNQGDIELFNTAQGYLIIRAAQLQKINYSVQYYVFTKQIEASQKTDKGIYEQASLFASKNSTDQAFSQAYKSETKLYKQVADAAHKSDYQLSGIDNAREIVSWAYKNEQGAVSPVIQTGSNYVIAHLSLIRPDGVQPLASVRQQVEPIVRNQKKGQKIAAQISTATALGSSLEALATKFNVEIKNIPGADFNQSYLPNIGEENALLGTIASTKEGQMTKPVLGNNAVFVAKLSAVSKPQPVADYSGVKKEQLNNLQPRIEYGMTEAIKKQMKIDDSRYNFF